MLLHAETLIAVRLVHLCLLCTVLFYIEPAVQKGKIRKQFFIGAGSKKAKTIVRMVDGKQFIWSS